VQSYQAAVNDEAEASPTGGAVCPCCLGVLQLVTEYADKIAAEIQRQAFDASTFNLSVLLPAPLYVRQWGFWHLLVQSNAVGSDSAATGEGVIDCKEVLKWLLPTLLEQRLAAKYTTKSDVMLTLSYTAQHLFAEAEFLGQMDKKVSAKRSRSRKGGKLTRGEPEIPAQAVARMLPGISHANFVAKSCVPPAATETSAGITVLCLREPVFVAGNYCKYDRETSQSAWMIGPGAGERKGSGSTDEYISGLVKELFGCSDHTFIAAGREDIDVRMLGEGRPFVVNLLNAKRVKVNHAEIEEVQARINLEADGMVEVTRLRRVEKRFCEVIKATEETKRKSYCCVVHLTDPPPKEEILAIVARTMEEAKAAGGEGLVVKQKTPLRVLHRRSLLVREKCIHSMEVEVINRDFVTLRLDTQAGTYIKEFVTGDMGRTRPSFGDLMGCEADILQLDVEKVHCDLG